MPRRALNSMLSLTLVALCASAWGQSAPPPSPAPDDAVEARIERLERGARDFAPAKPSTGGRVQVAGPGAEQTSGVAPDPMGGVRGGDLREGAAVVDVRGRVAFTPGGWVFAADPVNAPENTPRVLLRLLPSPTSERLRAVVRAREVENVPPATFRVSGRVLVDRGRVFLLPVFATVLDPETSADTPAQEAQDVSEAPAQVAPEVSSPDDPSVRELIERVERASDAERRGMRESFAGGDAGSTPGVRLLAGRVGRLSRASDGRLIFAFERGVHPDDDDDMIDRVAVLPCRLYGALEQLWASRGDGARLIVSGEAFRDEDRWFLLPSLVEIDRTATSGLRTLR